MFDNFTNIYSLPLWLQVYLQSEDNPIIRCKLRMISSSLNNRYLLSQNDYNLAKKYKKLGWWKINKDFMLIADESNEGIEEYNYYYNMYENSNLFIKKYHFIFSTTMKI